MEVILNFFWFKNVEVFLLARHNFLEFVCILILHLIDCVHRILEVWANIHFFWFLLLLDLRLRLNLVRRVRNVHWLPKSATTNSHISIRIRWTPVAGAILVLRICIVCLIIGLILPLTALLTFDHFSEILLHRLCQLTILVEWSVIATVNLCVLVVNVHAATAWEVSIANNKSLHKHKKLVISNELKESLDC